VDDDAAIYVTDIDNDRVVKWTSGGSNGQVMAGGHGRGNRDDQLNVVISVVVDKNGTLFICDRDNKRVLRWGKNESHGETIITDITCYGLAMDNEGSLYVSDDAKSLVMKWPSGQIVAGGNGKGEALNQLRGPYHVFVDRDQSVFVADT
jgi:sugar lactone lactonase YvrE